MSRLLCLAALTWALLAGDAGASTFVQSVQNSTFFGTTVDATLTGVVTGHSIRVVVVSNPDTLTISSLSDGVNTYHLLAPAATSSGNSTAKIAYAVNVTGGSLTVTATVSGTIGAAFILLEEWSGDATTGTIDGTNGQYVPDGTVGTTVDSGNITMANANDDIWLVDFQPQNLTPTLGSGYSFATNAAPFYTMHKASTGAGTVDPSATTASGSFDNYMLAAAFAQSGGGGPTCSRGLLLTGVGC